MPRVLICDDDPIIRECYRECLEAHGYTVLEASCGREAEVAMAEGVDAAICDGTLPWTRTGRPGPYGYALCCIARGLGVQAVMVSGDCELVALAGSNGFPSFLKPPEIPKVLAALSPALEAA